MNSLRCSLMPAASLMAVLEDFAAYANGVAPGQAVVIQDIPDNGGVAHSD